jgi:D-3-phosphoglycerate dehydrogenase
MKVYFADTAHPSLMERLAQAGFDCLMPQALNAANASELLADATGIVIRSKIKITAGLIEKLPQLRFIARVGAGMENIDVDFATKKGIVCLHAPEGNRNAVAEHALGMLLALMNNLLRADREVRQGIWKREENRGYELSGLTVGLIGYGNTGAAFAKLLAGFDLTVLAYDKYKTGFGGGYVKESTPERIYSEADVLSLHVPLTQETTGLVGFEMLSRFKKPVYLINTSRGQCLKTADLLEAIDKGLVRGAALDVLEFEDVSFEQLNAGAETYQKLLQSEKVILSPHIAGWTFESSRRMADVLLKKILELNLLPR